MALTVTLRKTVSPPVLEAAGRIVDVDVKKFSKRLATLYAKNLPLLVIDLTRANFIDSHGLGILVYYHSLMQREQRELVILNSDPGNRGYISRLFELTNLNRVIRVIANLQEIRTDSAPAPASTGADSNHR